MQMTNKPVGGFFHVFCIGCILHEAKAYARDCIKPSARSSLKPPGWSSIKFCVAGVF